MREIRQKEKKRREKERKVDEGRSSEQDQLVARLSYGTQAAAKSRTCRTKRDRIAKSKYETEPQVANESHSIRAGNCDEWPKEETHMQ